MLIIQFEKKNVDTWTICISALEEEKVSRAAFELLQLFSAVGNESTCSTKSQAGNY